MNSNNSSLTFVTSDNNDGLPFTPISMKGIDCTQEQINIISAVWPTFQNCRVNNEFILDATEFKEPDTHRLSCIFKKSVRNIVGAYILLVVS
ncbi:MAG: hypothetical protein ACI9T7_000124 [Oleiphilaceae bacterium]|jgi:hypothetical protein